MRVAQRARRETLRWVLLMTMNTARPSEATLAMLRGVAAAVYADATDNEIRRELDYLQGRELVSLRTDPLGQVRAKLERYGIDIVEYTIDCEPGIARPAAGG
nr:hypothetical protein [Roseateles oligotrophus]